MLIWRELTWLGRHFAIWQTSCEDYSVNHGCSGCVSVYSQYDSSMHTQWVRGNMQSAHTYTHTYTHTHIKYEKICNRNQAHTHTHTLGSGCKLWAFPCTNCVFRHEQVWYGKHSAWMEAGCLIDSTRVMRVEGAQASNTANTYTTYSGRLQCQRAQRVTGLQDVLLTVSKIICWIATSAKAEAKYFAWKG